jgi:mevalonate kinase/lipid-binding SYLF domain-containing protein
MARCIRPDGSTGWSAPSAFTFGGGGGGLEFGGAMSHYILVLNTDEAVRYFTGHGLNMSFTLQAALGPHQAGRCVEGGVRVALGSGSSGDGSPGDAGGVRVVPTYVYGQSGGFFLGAGLQGGLVLPRAWENSVYYCVPSATAEDILSGRVGLAPAQARPEVALLHAVLLKAEDGDAEWSGGMSRGGWATGQCDAEAGEFELFVPGRVCLFGEHSDWAGGLRSSSHPHIGPGATLVVGLSHEGLHARARRNSRRLILRSVLDHGEVLGPVEFPMDVGVLLTEASKGGFWSYACGVAAKVMSMFVVGGLELDNYQTTLPVRKGLSSSAAMCVLVARAFSRAYGLNLSIRGEMELAYQGEIATPSACGRMDQACAYGPCPVLMRYDGESLEVEELTVGAPLHLVVADLNASKCTTTILEALQRAYPLAQNEVHEGVQLLLGSLNADITTRAVAHVAAGELEALGALMDEAQEAFDRYGGAACPAELTAPVLHRVLGDARVRVHAFGGKGVGSQGDGTVQFLCRGEAGQAAAAKVLREELGLTTLTLTIAAGKGGGVGATPRARWLQKTKERLEVVRAASVEKLTNLGTSAAVAASAGRPRGAAAAQGSL